MRRFKLLFVLFFFFYYLFAGVEIIRTSFPPFSPNGDGKQDVSQFAAEVAITQGSYKRWASALVILKNIGG